MTHGRGPCGKTSGTRSARLAAAPDLNYPWADVCTVQTHREPSPWTSAAGGRSGLLSDKTSRLRVIRTSGSASTWRRWRSTDDAPLPGFASAHRDPWIDDSNVQLVDGVDRFPVMHSRAAERPPLRPLHLVVRETEFCGQRLAGDFSRRMRENGRNSVRRPRHASLTDRNCEGFCRPGNRVGLPGLHGGGRSRAKPVSATALA